MESSPESKQELPKFLCSKSDTVKVTKEKDPTSEVLQGLNRGGTVTVIEKIGSRYRVKLAKGKTGWVSKLRLSDRQPSEQLKGLPDLAKLKDKESPTVTESRSGGSIRGQQDYRSGCLVLCHVVGVVNN